MISTIVIDIDHAERIEFNVVGLPAPGGSRKFVGMNNGRGIIVEDCKRSGPWRNRVASYGVEAMFGRQMFSGCALGMSIQFQIPRPKSHYGTGRNCRKVKPSAPVYPIVKPDTTKLVRSTEDALTGIVWKDDAQIVIQHVGKEFSTGQVGAKIVVWKL